MVEQSPPRVAQLYFDEDADARLAEALRRRGYDVETSVLRLALYVSRG
jgi:hypothetical protein